MWGTGVAALTLGAAVLLGRAYVLRSIPRPAEGRVAIAVLGDSDSHSYGDRLWFPPDSGQRGGAARAVTLQWTELLASLRADAMDPGPWGVHGYPARVARVMGWVGIPLRTPRKEDFAFNLATSGARCEHLVSPLGQLNHLRRILARAPESWAQGAVVIRIGINDLGGHGTLDAVAAGAPTAAEATRSVCLETITAVVREIRALNPDVRIVLVGIADNTNWPPNGSRWTGNGETQRIREFLDGYDAGLRRIVSTIPHAAFLDDRAWFGETFGERGPDGSARYEAPCIGAWRLTYRQGDDLGSAILADGHAGTLLNLLWMRPLVDALRSAGAVTIPEVRRDELLHEADRLMRRAGSFAAPRDAGCGGDAA